MNDEAFSSRLTAPDEAFFKGTESFPQRDGEASKTLDPMTNAA